jgi:hypothetical protein
LRERACEDVSYRQPLAAQHQTLRVSSQKEELMS